jgi:hypothetical protein
MLDSFLAALGAITFTQIETALFLFLVCAAVIWVYHQSMDPAVKFNVLRACLDDQGKESFIRIAILPALVTTAYILITQANKVVLRPEDFVNMFYAFLLAWCGGKPADNLSRAVLYKWGGKSEEPPPA